jgi:UMP-CMP kinase
MFTRGTSIARIGARTSSRLTRPNLISFSRYNSTKPQQTTNNDKGSSGNESKGKQGNAGKILLIVGGLAIASSVATSFVNNKAPESAVEPEPAVQSPAFADGEIKVIFVLGGPGSGKGTQCAKLVNEYGCIHLSAGDLLRAEQQREGSKYGELIAKYIREGLIVPQEVTIALLEQAIKEEHKKGNKLFLIDGFPRKMDQALTFEQQIATSSLTIFFECPEQVMLGRLLERGKTSGRTDDNIESIKKRFRTFVDTSMPVVEHFEKQNKVVKLSCDKSVDAVYGQVKAALTEKGINP